MASLREWLARGFLVLALLNVVGLFFIVVIRFPSLSAIAFAAWVGGWVLLGLLCNVEALSKTLTVFTDALVAFPFIAAFELGEGFALAEVVYGVGYVFAPATGLSGQQAYGVALAYFVHVALLFALCFFLKKAYDLTARFELTSRCVKKSWFGSFVKEIPWSEVSAVSVEYYAEGETEEGGRVYTLSVSLKLKPGSEVSAGVFECVAKGDVRKGLYDFQDVVDYQLKEYVEKMRFLEGMAGFAKWQAVIIDDNGKEVTVVLPKPSEGQAER